MDLSSRTLDRFGLRAESDCVDTQRNHDVTEALSLFIISLHLDAPLTPAHLLELTKLKLAVSRRPSSLTYVQNVMLRPQATSEREMAVCLWLSLRAATIFNSGRRLYTHRHSRNPGVVDIHRVGHSSKRAVASLPLADLMDCCFRPDTDTHQTGSDPVFWDSSAPRF